MRYFLQVVTSKSSLLAPSVYLFFDSCRYIFNAGDGLQRFMTEQHIRAGKVKHIFITSLKTDYICSLPSMILNLTDVCPANRFIHSPPGLLELARTYYSFIFNKEFEFIEYTSKDLIKKPFNFTTKHEFSDENVKIKVIPIVSNGKVGSVYIVECCKLGIKFNGEKLKQLGIKGRMVKDLQINGSLLVCDRLVYLEEVTEKPVPQAIFAILDLPDTENCANIKESLLKYLGPDYDLQLFVHFTQKEVVLCEEYIDMLLSFPNTKNMVLDLSTDNNVPVFRKSDMLLRKLNFIYPKNFPLPLFPQHPDSDLINILSQAIPNFCYANSLTKFILSPAANKGIDRTEELKPINQELFDMPELKTWKSHKCDYKEIVDTTQPGSDPQLLFLGTASMKPGSYRNVSGIHFSQWGGGMLLDCGEGSYYQLVRSFGNDIINVLLDLKVVLISHMHADHHLGLIKLLHERAKVSCERLIVVGPPVLQVYLEACSNCHGPFYYTFQVPSDINVLGIEIKAIPVDHRIEAYGFVISHHSGWKLVYSGDTRPCPDLIQAGYNATVLIHEATFDDNLTEMATDKFHSTLSQALSVASAMEVWKVVLTHFSQRYSKIPENTKVDSIYTFDLMKFNFSDCTMLANIMPTLLKEWDSDEDSENN